MDPGSGRKERIKALFKKGQRCLVRYMDQYWAALIMRARKADDGYFYLVHYDGWSKKHDEEVRQEDIIKYNPEMIGPVPGTEVEEEGPGSLTSVKKRKQDASPGAIEVGVELRLHMPAVLKTVVLKDCEHVTQTGLLLPLPRPAHHRPSVKEVLEKYKAKAAAEIESEGKEGDDAKAAKLETLTEIVNGLHSYFDQSLPHFLLYHQEMAQHREVCTPGVQPSEVYGAEHLVRLLVKLPELVPVWCMSPQDTLNLEVRLYDLMQWAAGEAQGSLFSTREEYKPNPDAAPELLLMGPGTGEATKATSLAAATPA